MGLAVTVLLVAACDAGPDRPTEVDLLAGLSGAERRGAGPGEAIRADVVGIDGDVRAALVMRAPARVTWTLRLPLHASLTTAVVLIPDTEPAAPEGVTVRIGLSDGRNYQEVREIEPTGVWQPLTLDLREYSEWKFSVFYQPLRRTWQLVFNADATPGGTVAWARPVVARP